MTLTPILCLCSFIGLYFWIGIKATLELKIPSHPNLGILNDFCHVSLTPKRLDVHILDDGQNV